METLVASGGTDTVVRLWNLLSDGALKSNFELQNIHSSDIQDCHFSPASNLIVSTSNKLVLVWDVEKGGKVAMLEQIEGWQSIRFRFSRFCCRKNV